MLKHLFEAHEIIYESANSIIYRGTRIKDKCPVVLKKLNRVDPTPIESSRFRREYTLANQFDHPGIIKVYEILETDDNSLLIVMEDCGGESIQRCFSYFKSLGLVEKLEIAYRITEYLEHIHTLKIIHMDLNPANIVWCPEYEQIKIIDFGISTELSSEIEFINPTALEGTLAYMSPEQTGRLNRTIDYRTDLYSLGVTFYEFFTGSLPFTDQDPLALIYSHIAIMPTEASKLNIGLPHTISQIISKLMAKDADERYQSASGVKHDLHCCINNIDRSGIKPFKIGSKDVSMVFKIPQKLYFREAESCKILKVFEEVCDSGNFQLLFVSGQSGVGKSMFVREIIKNAIEKKAFFISGKYGEMEQSMPHSIIIQALQSFFDQILSGSEDQLTYWQDKINKAIYPNGRIITDVIPVAKQIIKEQPPLIQLDTKAAQNRFNQCLFVLFQTMADKDHPFVLFLDDLQWADNSIFSLLDLFICKKIRYLFVVGAYRCNEIAAGHPISDFIDSISKSNMAFNCIKLQPFDLEQTINFIINVFNYNEPKVRELGELLFLKTQGNPFFIVQSLYSLYSLGSIYSDNFGKWVWERSSGGELVDDVVDLLISKLRILSDESQYIIMIAACIDTKVSLEKLITATGYRQSKIVPYLSDLVSRHFFMASSSFKYINATDESIKADFRFIHDRVRQAAFSIAQDYYGIHHKIGLRFWDELEKNNSYINVFDVVKQCNKSPELLSHDRKIALADLNLKAGLSAKNNSAWDQALHYFSTGLSLLTKDDWNSSYKLTFSLHCESAEIASLVSDFHLVDHLSDILLKNTTSFLDKCLVWEIQVMALIAQGRPTDAVHLGLQVLRKLGIKINVKTPKIIIFLSLLKIKLSFKSISNVIANSKPILDPKHLAASRLLMRLCSATYVSGSTAFVAIVLKYVWFFVKYGYSPNVPPALAGIGVLFAVIGDLSSAFKFSELAISFCDRDDAKLNAARAVYITTAFIGVHSVPYKELLPNLLKHYKIGIETGDQEYAAFNIYCYCYLQFLSGEKLKKVNSLMSKYAESVKRQDIVANYFSLYQQLVQNLLGKSDDPVVLSGNACDESKIKSHIEEYKNEIGLFDFYTKKILLAYLFYDLNLAHASCEKAMRYIQAAKTKHDVPIALFFQALTICALIKSDAKYNKSAYWKALKHNIRKIKKLSKHNPSSFSHKYWLLVAESALLKGDKATAEKCYHMSIRLAKASGIIQEMAIAIELLAIFYNNCGYKDIYHFQIRSAYIAYKKWGAIAKCRALEQKYSDAFKSDTVNKYLLPNNHKAVISTIQNRTTTEQTSLENIDLMSVLKASQAISSKMDIDALSKNLLRIVLENAGGKKAF